MNTARTWKFWLCRSIAILAFWVLALLMMFLGWMSGGFETSGERYAAGAGFWVWGGLGLLFGAFGLYRRNARAWLIGLVALSAVLIFSFTVSDGWSDDLFPFLLAYPVIWFGNWLSRK